MTVGPRIALLGVRSDACRPWITLRLSLRTVRYGAGCTPSLRLARRSWCHSSGCPLCGHRPLTSRLCPPVRLCAQQAHAAGWKGEDREEVGRLCALVGNLPRALVLLAPWAVEMPLCVLAALVTTTREALTRTKEAAQIERHQRIAACLLVSFDLLSEGACPLLTCLSVLPDGAATQRIAPFTGITAWQQPLAEGVRHALLPPEQQRYRFHPLLRYLVLDQLGEATAAWQRRYVAFFRQLVVDHQDLNDGDHRSPEGLGSGAYLCHLPGRFPPVTWVHGGARAAHAACSCCRAHLGRCQQAWCGLPPCARASLTAGLSLRCPEGALLRTL